MEFDARRYTPECSFGSLLQELEEQSEMCDITVRMGSWGRKYHRRVLVTSPFFDCILKNDFVEKQTGLINIAIGTATSIDMVLRYLYGEGPNFSDNNIEEMFAIAEFLMIPNLKSACVKWMKSQTISVNNCLQWHELSLLYELELSKCSEYVSSHLIEIFADSISLSLTFEFIDYVFKEERFCYFQMEQRLQFLIRWYKTQPETRKYNTERLLESIVFEEIAPTSLHAIKCDSFTEELLRHVESEGEDVKRDILISKHMLRNEVGVCYDLRRNRWVRLNHIPLNASHSFITYNMVGTNPEDSGVYWSSLMSHFSINKQTLSKLCLDSNEIVKYEVVYKSTGQEVEQVNLVYMSDNVLVMCTCSDTGSFGQLNWKPLKGKHSEIMIGQLVDLKVEMVPQFSISNSKVLAVTVNKCGIIALMLDSRDQVLVYDPVKCSLNTLKLETKNDDKLCPTDNGFVIHNDVWCINIVRLPGTDLSTRYESHVRSLENRLVQYKGHKLSFNKQMRNMYRYYFCNNTWYRLTANSPYRFQYVGHDSLVKASSPDKVKWVNLRPLDESSDSSCIPTDMHHLKVSCLLPLCHTECPHCRFAKR